MFDIAEENAQGRFMTIHNEIIAFCPSVKCGSIISQKRLHFITNMHKAQKRRQNKKAVTSFWIILELINTAKLCQNISNSLNYISIKLLKI